MRVTSEMVAYTDSAGAAMSREISSLLVMVRVDHGHLIGVEQEAEVRALGITPGRNL